VVGTKPLWAMMETALGVVHSSQIAAHPRLEGMVMGTNHLGRKLRARDRADRTPMLPGLGVCLLAARAQRRIIVDGVCDAFRDDVRLAAQCAQGRDPGVDGKTLIRAAQPAIVNRAFGPDAKDVTPRRADCHL